MKQKRISILFITVFLAICLTFSLGTLVFGPAPAAANEQLSKTPAWTDKKGNWNDAYLSDVAAWVNDHFFLRQELISTEHALTGAVFGTSGSDSVILGKDGWLFYGSTLGDFTGTETLSPRELYAVANNLQVMARYAKQSGKQFLFVIAPNKNSLYPQYMPSYGVRAEIHDAHRLMDLLDTMEVSHIDLFDAFSREPVLYYATDSHWNQQGAALGADLINGAFGVQSNYYAGPFAPSEVPYTGDIYEMLYPAFSGRETEPVYQGVLAYTHTGSSTKADSITLTTVSEKEGTLLAYRDSFGILLYPYLADSYGNATFSRSTSYDLTKEADFVLVEIVERNLNYLIAYLPVLENPQVDISLPEAAGSCTLEQKKGKAPEGFVLWQGTIPEETDTDSPVYVTCASGVYQALLLKDNGYAVYLPEGVTPQSISFRCQNQWQTYDCN